MPTQYEILINDFAAAISQVSTEEIQKTRIWVELFLDEYGFTDELEFAKSSPVQALRIHFSDYGKYDVAVSYLALAEIYIKRIEESKKQNNSFLANIGIDAINKANMLFEENRLEKIKEEKVSERAIEAQRAKANQRMNDARHAPLRKLVKTIIDLYEPTILGLKADKKNVTYFNIARRIAPKVESLNKIDDEHYILGDQYDQITAIQERLRKAVSEGDLKSTRYYKK